MKKIIILTLFICGAQNLFAAQIFTTDLVFNYTSVEFQENVNSYSSIGPGFTGYLGSFIGVVVDFSFLFTLAWTTPFYTEITEPNYIENTAVNVKVGMDLLIGPGFLIEPTPFLSFITAAGLHYNTIIFRELTKSVTHNTIGAGGAVFILFRINPVIVLKGGLKMGFDFLMPAGEEDIVGSYVNNFSLTPSLGLALKL